MDIETAVAHLEASIAGWDELGDVDEADALTALRVLEAEIERLHIEIARLQPVEPSRYNQKFGPDSGTTNAPI